MATAADRTYFQLINTVFSEGTWGPNRTGEDTLSVFCPPTMKYDLINDGFPILLSKKVLYKSAFEEMLWMVSGSTDVGKLKTKIWCANSSREFLDGRGLTHYEVGDIGPGYGFQMRHSGAKYRGKSADYTGEGFDQLAECVRKMKEDPTSRQNLMCLWSPKDTHMMALPPCHYSTVFEVRNGKYLNAHLTQRSGDIGLGIPFNMVGYGLLMHLLAHDAGLTPHIFAHTITNAHIYMTHVETLKKQLLRIPDGRPTPRLRITAPPGTAFDAIKMSDIHLDDYFPLIDPPLTPVMRMAV